MTACLDGLVAPDDLADHAASPGQIHRVTGLPGGGADSLPLAVSALRGLGARRAWLVWPVAGDPTGLPGPTEANRLALSAGQAVIVDLDPGAADPRSLALVPSRLGSSGVVWTSLDVGAPGAAATSLSEADRALKVAIRESTEALDALDVARTSPDAADAVEAVRERAVPLELPPGYDGRARSVLDTSQRLATLLELAARDDGAAVSRSEADRRIAVLRDLSRTVRHAFTASVNALAEEGLRAR
jgi:hypothetical protein